MDTYQGDDQSWPVFLQLLDSDPGRAWEMFYRFAWTLLSQQPPAELASIPEPDRNDLIEDIVVFCARDGFRVLKRYRDTGHEFAGWFYVLTKRKAVDWWRRRGREFQRREPRQEDGSHPADAVAAAGDNPERREILRQLVDRVMGLLDRLGRRCRLLLTLAAEEYTPREMVAVLKLDRSQNKKISDDLRYCRRRLKELIARESDVDPGTMFGD